MRLFTGDYRDLATPLRDDRVLGAAIQGDVSSDLVFTVYLDRAIVGGAPLPGLPGSIFVPGLGTLDTEPTPIDIPVAQSFTSRERPLRPGASIGRGRGSAGTACAVVRRAVGSGRGGRFLLSCEHVLYDPQASGDAPLLQPAHDDGGIDTQSAVARNFLRGGLYAHGLNDVDAAIARLDDDVTMLNRPLGGGPRFRGVRRHLSGSEDLVLHGRSSGRNVGVIDKIGIDIRLAYPGPRRTVRRLHFRNLVRCHYRDPTLGGDSGAPVVSKDGGELLGMHVGAEGSNAYFCPIDPIFRRLQIGLA